MTNTDITLLVTSLSSLAPGGLALLLAMAAYLRSHTTETEVRANKKRLDSIENGGTQDRIDTRLATIGLVDRREAGSVPTPTYIAPPTLGPLPTSETPGRGL